MRKVYGFGETVLDIIFKDGSPTAARPGGSVLNSFVSLGRLGWDPCFISEYGMDDVGRLIEDFLRDNGVNTSFVNRYTEGQSAIALAFLDRDNNARYSFYKNFPAQRLQELPASIQEDDIVMFGSIYASSAAVRKSVLRFLDMARGAGALILYDPNFREAHLSELEELRPRIIENLAYADIVRGSDEDFKLVFGMDDPEVVADRFLKNPGMLIYTRNRQGVKVISGKKQADVPTEKITPVSTIGAGDNFNAGIVHYLLSQGILRKDLREMNAAELEAMVSSGIQFASHVCMTYDNYISRDFSERLLS